MQTENMLSLLFHFQSQQNVYRGLFKLVFASVKKDKNVYLKFKDHKKKNISYLHLLAKVKIKIN